MKSFVKQIMCAFLTPSGFLHNLHLVRARMRLTPSGPLDHLAPIFKDAMVNERMNDFPSVFIKKMLNVWNRHVMVNEEVTDCQIPLDSWV